MKALLLTASVAAALTGAPDKDQPARKQADFTVTERTFKSLQTAQEALSKKEFARAQQTLDRLAQRRSLTEHERCLILQTQAVLQVERTDYRGAIKTLREALRRGALPSDTLLSMRFNLGQVLLADEQLEAARTELVRWDREAPKPSGAALYTVAAVHARLERFGEALGYINRALAAERRPRESWRQLKLACLVKLDRPSRALPVMLELVELRPQDGGRWRQLSALYSQAGKHALAVATLELAFARGLLERPPDVRLLAENLAAVGVPDKAAQVLKRALVGDRMPRDVDTLMLQARCHLAARDRSAARPVLRGAGRLSSDGRSELELARLEARTRNWGASVKAASRALEK
ncbi:MAG: hypothetical protein AAFU79_14045, partial [Myxococcota bacterium]